MIKMIISLVILIALAACAPEKNIDDEDWKFVPCNGTTPNCGNLDGNKRNNG